MLAREEFARLLALERYFRTQVFPLMNIGALP
jgi:hypothetical protein